MGEVTPGRPIRRHCHYKHPSGKGKGTDRAGNKPDTDREREAQQRHSPSLPGRLTYCASFPPGITGCKARDGPLGGGIKRVGRHFGRDQGFSQASLLALSGPLVCRACLSSSWVSRGK